MSAANEPRERSEPAKRRASERVGGSGGAKPPGRMIDAHQHFWRYDAAQYAWIDSSMAALRRDFLPEELAALMNAGGVDATIAVQARQDEAETAWLLDLAARHPFIRGVVGWVDLQAADADRRLEQLAATPRLLGVRHVVQAEPDGFLHRHAFRQGVAAVGRCDLVYDILIYARQLPEAIRFAADFPDQRFVLDHLGKPDIRGNGLDEWRRRLQAMADLPHVWCKLSGLVTEADWRAWTPGQLRPYLDGALDAFGPSRLMFGSDWPVCTLAASYGEVLGLVRDAIAEYSADEQAQILGKTAEDVYLS
jgi:L-fucono-1,5-lactonase